MFAPTDPSSPQPPGPTDAPAGAASSAPSALPAVTGHDEAARDQAAHAQRMRLLGILLMCGAVACFACLDATAKYLGRHVDVLAVVWARYASAFVLALLVFNPITRPGLLRTQRPALQIGRSALLLGTTILNFAALKFLQLDQALAIMFSTPLMVAALAGPMLGEKIGPRRWVAIVVGLVGVLIVLQPGFGAVHPAALLSTLSAVCAAFYAIATRVLSRFDSDATTLFYSNLVGVLALAPVMPFVWTTPSDPLLIVLMIGFGAFGSLGHFLLIVAHRHTPASILSPFSYSQILWTTILGFVVFGDVPNRWTIAGVTVVIASGLYLLHRERVRRRG